MVGGRSEGEGVNLSVGIPGISSSRQTLVWIIISYPPPLHDKIISVNEEINTCFIFVNSTCAPCKLKFSTVSYRFLIYLGSLKIRCAILLILLVKNIYK